jgi:hypothetical protein
MTASPILANPGDRYVDRAELALVPTPSPTDTWKPVPHEAVVSAVEYAVLTRGFTIESERFGLARGTRKMFGVITLGRTGHPDWTYCVGVRNSHDQSFAAGICCGVSVLVCSNLCFGGEHVLKRRHTSGIDLSEMAQDASRYLGEGFVGLEERLEDLRDRPVKSEDEARCLVVKAAEYGAIPSCDILPVFNEYRHPRHSEFNSRTRWSLLNAFTEIAHKYPPSRHDVCHRKLPRLFGLDGQPALLNA